VEHAEADFRRCDRRRTQVPVFKSNFVRMRRRAKLRRKVRGVRIVETAANRIVADIDGDERNASLLLRALLGQRRRYHALETKTTTWKHATCEPFAERARRPVMSVLKKSDDRRKSYAAIARKACMGPAEPLLGAAFVRRLIYVFRGQCRKAMPGAVQGADIRNRHLHGVNFFPKRSFCC